MVGTEFQDSNIIKKAFEKGAAYTTTEEGVFALLSPVLTPMRSQAKGYSKQFENSTNVSALTRNSGDSSNATGLDFGSGVPVGGEDETPIDQADEDDPGFLEKVKDVGDSVSKKISKKFDSVKDGVETVDKKITKTFAPVRESIVGQVATATLKESRKQIEKAFNSECIPCEFRFKMFSELHKGLWGGVEDQYSEFIELIENNLKSMLQQLQDAQDLFKLDNQYYDMCALYEYLNDFICIPDLSRMISALMALLSKSAFDITGLFNLLLQLVSPLLTPFLSNLVDALHQYLLLVIKPLECIMESMQRFLSKLEYNAIFGEVNLDLRVTGLRQTKPEREIIGVTPRLGFKIEDKYQDFSVRRAFGIEASDRNKEDVRITEAKRKLSTLESAKVDMGDERAVADHKKKLSSARAGLTKANEKASTSAVGRAKKALNKNDPVKALKSSLLKLVDWLKEATEHVEAIFQEIFDEFKKLLGQYVANGGSMLAEIVNRLGIIQMVNFIASLIEFYKKGEKCEEVDESDLAIIMAPFASKAAIFTDEDGNLHIVEKEDEIDTAVATLFSLSGREPFDEDEVNSEGPLARQKLRSLIEFTGDPVLDSSIAKTVESITTPRKAVFSCSTSVSEAEQVNIWIEELSV